MTKRQITPETTTNLEELFNLDSSKPVEEINIELTDPNYKAKVFHAMSGGKTRTTISEQLMLTIEDTLAILTPDNEE